LARAITQEPDVLLLDEPTSSLDLHRQFEVMNLLHELARERGMAIIFSVHDINLALRFADKFLLLRDGELYAYGGRDIITPKLIEEVFNVHAIIQHVDDHFVVIPIFGTKKDKNFMEVELGA
jgi:iron complex transport system ATP-binding protein